MKKVLVSAVCLLMLMCFGVAAEPEEGLKIDIKIEKVEDTYLVTIPADPSYKELKPVMTVYDDTIENAYAALLDDKGNEVSYIDVTVKDGKLSFTVTSGGVYRIIPCSKTNSGLIYDLGITNSLGGVDNAEAITASLESFLKGGTDVKTNISAEQESVLKKAYNDGKTVVFNETMKVEKASQTDKVTVYINDNDSYKAVLTVDIDIYISYSIDQGTSGTFSIKELNDPVKISVKAPDEIQKMVADGKDIEFSVLSVHDNEDPVSIKAYYSDGYIYFYADRFSSFTLVYREIVSAEPSGGNPVSNLKPVVNTGAK